MPGNKTYVMKKAILAVIFSLSVFISSAQRIYKVTLADNGNSTITTVALDENVVINISQDGNLTEWGVDRYFGRTDNNINRKLDPYTGRIEYYTENDNEAFKGKIKFIGKTLITYYATFDNPVFSGRIKSIGNQKFEYYSNYDEVASQGKIKQLGQQTFTYYSSFDNEAYKGKLKAVGSVGVTYYSSVEDKAFAGKVKSVGGSQFVYYSSQDPQKPLRGMLKTGRQLQTLNGIIFWIKYN